MIDLKIDHIGYAVSDIERSRDLFLKLGYEKLSDIIIDTSRGVKLLFINNGGIKVELISPIDDKSPVYAYLKKNGNTPYHICYLVRDINETIFILKKLKFKLIEKPKSAIAFNNKKVAFLYHIDYGVLELVES